MKKIFTLLIFAGFLSSASFAQDGRRDNYGNQHNSRYQSDNYSQNYNRQYAPSQTDNGGSREHHQWNNARNENDYGYSDNREYDQRQNWNRDRHNEWNREQQEGYGNYYPMRRHQTVFGDPEYNTRSGAWFQIELGRH